MTVTEIAVEFVAQQGECLARLVRGHAEVDSHRSPVAQDRGAILGEGAIQSTHRHVSWSRSRRGRLARETMGNERR